MAVIVRFHGIILWMQSNNTQVTLRGRFIRTLTTGPGAGGDQGRPGGRGNLTTILNSYTTKKSAYIVNTLINIKLRYTWFKCVWLGYFCWGNVERLLFNSQ